MTTYYSNRTTAQLQSELARIESSEQFAGPVFGIGHQNYRCAARDIRGELAMRGEDATGPGKKPEQAASILDPDAIFAARRTAAPVDTGNTDDHPDGQAVKSAEQLEAMRESIYAARRKPDITDQANIFPNRQELEL